MVLKLWNRFFGKPKALEPARGSGTEFALRPQEHFWFDRDSKPGVSIVRLKSEIHDWLVENKVPYKCFLSSIPVYNFISIEIYDKDLALLFKLTWM